MERCLQATRKSMRMKGFTSEHDRVPPGSGRRKGLAIWTERRTHVVGTSFGSGSEVEVWGSALAEEASQWGALVRTACSQRWTSRP